MMWDDVMVGDVIMDESGNRYVWLIVRREELGEHDEAFAMRALNLVAGDLDKYLMPCDSVIADNNSVLRGHTFITEGT